MYVNVHSLEETFLLTSVMMISAETLHHSGPTATVNKSQQ